MAESIQETKAAIRRQVRVFLKNRTSGQNVEASARARRGLEQQTAWQSAKAIFFYAPLAGELDIWPLVEDSLAAGKIVCLPRFDPVGQRYITCRIQNLGVDLATGQFGIREPAADCLPFPLNQLDLVLVPGVAFDLRGRRLGRGKGFYDRLLADAGGIKCGAAFDEQIVTEIPVEPHDVSVDCILTPTRWIQP
jgi:5-formyltetrahydrofolate cyclo-ligase